MNESEKAAEAAYQNLKPQVEGSQSQKAAFILGFLQGWNGGEDAEMRSAPYAKAMGSVSERGARAL